MTATAMTTVIDASPIAPRKVTRSATKTRMHGHEGPGLHYKHVRTTVALFMASTLFAKLDEITKKQFDVIVARNYDLSGVPDVVLEATTATLDDDVMKLVQDEFEFIPRMGNIRDHGACIGHCALCGKGNSKQSEGETNLDKLRYDFRLANVRGGTDLWVGADCIVNHALKVKGADTSTEAREILARSLREHIAIWRQEAWRAEHPTHADIPDTYSRIAAAMHEWKYYGRFGSREQDIEALGQTQRALWFALRHACLSMKANARFYERKNFLTECKTDEWKSARALIRSMEWLEGVLRATESMQGEQKYKALKDARAKREAAFAAMKRTPRRL